MGTNSASEKKQAASLLLGLILLLLLLFIGVRSIIILRSGVDPVLGAIIARQSEDTRTTQNTTKIKGLQRGPGRSSNIKPVQQVVSTTSATAFTGLRSSKSVFSFSKNKQEVIVEIKRVKDGEQSVHYNRYVLEGGSWQYIGATSKQAFYLHLLW